MENNQSRSAEWWLEDEGDVHDTLFGLVEHLRETCSWERQRDDFHHAMYAGARAAVGTSGYASAVGRLEYEPAYLSRNLTRKAVDTYVAKVAKHRPMPEILASHGEWRDQRRARKMTQLVDGEFFKHKIFKKWARVIVRDSAIFGRGILKIDVEKEGSKNIRCTRVKPRELWVDPADAEQGAPRNLYHVTRIDVGVLCRTYAGDDEDIKRDIQNAADDQFDDVVASEFDTVRRARFVETWHLCDDEDAHATNPPGKHECNGRHCIAVRNRTLVDEPWEFARFPFAILNYLEPVEGFFGTGICEQLEGFQREQELMSEKVSNGHYYTGGGIIFVDRNADLVEEDFTNDTNVRVMLKNPGSDVREFQPSPVHPQDYNYLRDLDSDGLNEVGLNTMSTTGSAPTGVTAAVALERLDDIQDERLSMQGYGYAEWCCDVAELFLMWIQHIVKSGGEYCTEVPLRTGFTKLSWKDVKVDSYIIKTMNAALMAMTPAARRQTLNDWFLQGQIDGLTFMRYLDSPDTYAEVDAVTADRVYVDEVLDHMLDAENPADPEAYIPPDPYSMDLKWALPRAMKALAKATMSGCDEPNLELVREWALEIESITKPPTPPVNDNAMAAMALPTQAPANDAMAPPIAMPPAAAGIQ